MADSKLTALTELAAAPAAGDWMYIVDASAGVAGSKKITVKNLFAAATATDVTQHGATGDGVTDDTTAIEAAITAAADGEVLFPPGTYVCNNTLDFDPSCSVVFQNATVDFSGASSFTDNACLRFYGGAQTALPAQSGDEVVGNRTWVSASAHGLAVGDVIVVHNTTNKSYSTYNNSYQKQERFVVREVPTTTTFETTEIAKLIWTAAESTWTKLPNESPSISGSGLVIGPGAGTGDNKRCIHVENTVYARVSGVRVRSADYAGIHLAGCYGAVIDSVVAMKEVDDDGAGLSYGLVIGSSQDVRVVNSNMHGDRHAVAVGGAGLNIDIHVSNCSLSSNIGAAADFHGNTTYSSYKHCHIDGGVAFGGNFNEVSHNTIHVKNTVGILFAECLGMSHTLRSNTLVDLVSGTYGVKDYEYDAGVTDGGTVVINGLHCETPSAAAGGSAIWFRDDATSPTTAVDWDISNVTMSHHQTASTYGILIGGNAGTPPGTVTIRDCRTTGGIYVEQATNVDISNCRVVNPLTTSSFLVGTATANSVSGHIVIKDCVCELMATGGYRAFHINGATSAPCDYVSISNCLVMGATASYRMLEVAEADIVVVNGMRAITAPSDMYFVVASTVAEFRLSNFHFPAYSATLSGTKHYLDVTGVGTPESALVGSVGSMVRRTDGGANTTLYIKEANDTNTGWAAM